jgi:RNA polymerase sigma-70 factor (ECF subfamily)
VRFDQKYLGLFMDHRPELLAYAHRIIRDHASAEDIVQEAWLRFADATRGALVEEPIRYLYRIVRNLAIDGRRRQLRDARRTVSDGDLADRLVAANQSPEDSAADQADLRTLEAALAELPARTRAALEMHRFGGYTLKEIAAHLGISIGLAHSLVIDGVEHCRTRLQSLGGSR